MLIHLNQCTLNTADISERHYDKISAPVVSNIECGNEFTSKDMSSTFTYMKDDSLTWNDLIEVATELASAVSINKRDSNTVYSTFKTMIDFFRKGEVFEVNYINLDHLPKHDGTKVVKKSTLPLRKRSQVEYNHKISQRKKVIQAKSVKK